MSANRWQWQQSEGWLEESPIGSVPKARPGQVQGGRSETYGEYRPVVDDAVYGIYED